MADPELDLEDTHLSRALDELARLVDAPVQKVISAKSSRSESDENDGENQIPQPLPEAIPIEVPLPPTPVAVQPTINAVLPPAAEGTVADRGLLAELSALSAGAAAIEMPATPSSADRVGPRGRRIDFSPTMMSIVAVATFVAGMLTERLVHILENLGRPSAAVTAESKNAPAANELTGRITYKTKEGESQPDRGARVLVFPQKRLGEVKLSIVGFRPADEPSDQLVANAALKALGGGAATVDAEGNYKLPVESGSYRVLVLSHFQARDESAADPALDKLLAEYFDKPDQLLGRLQFQFAPLRIKGTADVLDHSF